MISSTLNPLDDLLPEDMEKRIVSLLPDNSACPFTGLSKKVNRVETGIKLGTKTEDKK